MADDVATEIMRTYWPATAIRRADIERMPDNAARDELPVLSAEGRAEIMQRQLMQKPLPDSDGYDEVREQFDLDLLRDFRILADPEQFEQARV